MKFKGPLTEHNIKENVTNVGLQILNRSTVLCCCKYLYRIEMVINNRMLYFGFVSVSKKSAWSQAFYLFYCILRAKEDLFIHLWFTYEFFD